MFNVIANEYFSMIFFADKNYTLQNGNHNHYGYHTFQKENRDSRSFS